MSKKYPSTQVSMLDRLTTGDGSRDWNRAWASFVEIYTPALQASIEREFRQVGWFKVTQEGLQTVLSSVIFKFLKSSGSFRYDPLKGSFRSYLYKIIKWCVRDYMTASNRHPLCESTDTSEIERKNNELKEQGGENRLIPPFERRLHPDANNQHPEQPDQICDRAWKMAYIRTYLEDARERLGPQTILIFEMTKVLDQPVDQVMEQLRVSRTTVDNANRRVMQLLRKLIDNSPLKDELL